MTLQDNDNLRTVIESAPIGICILDAATFTAEILNDKFLEIAGKPREAILGKWYWEPFAEARPYYEDALKGVVETGKPYYADEVKLMLIRHGSEEWIFVTFVYAPVKNDQGDITKIAVWVLENTTQVVERQKVHDAKTAAENERDRLYEFFRQSPVGICVLIGPDLVYNFVNPRYQALLPGRELQNRSIFEALPELVGSEIEKILRNVLSKGEPISVQELLIPVAETEGGPLLSRYFTFEYTPWRNFEGVVDGILAVVVEVTDQVKTRQHVERAEESLRLAVEAADMGTFSMNAINHNFFASPRLRELFGFDADEPVSYESFLEQIHPEFRPAFQALVKAALFNGERFEMEYRVLGRNGTPERWLKGAGMLQHGSHYRENLFTGVMMDITEEKLDEQRKDDFIGMVSHELKTPLTSLSGYLQLLAKNPSNDQDDFTTKALDKSIIQIGKMTRMINGFLNVSRLQSGKIHIEKESFELDGLIREIINEFQLTNNTHQFYFAPCEPVVVNADREKIGNVVSNFFSNAIKYSPNKKTIEITCEIIGDIVQTKVKDFGIGVSKEDASKIFDRYYRVKNADSISGFGIGLYLCAEIINRHEGHIGIESEIGQGSTFWFSLPIE